MDKEQKNNTEQPKKEPLLSFKRIKKGLKYIGIGLAVVAGLFLLTKPPVLFMILRIGLPLALIGGVGYGAVSMVKAITKTKSSTKKNKQQAPQKKQGGFSRRVIRRRKPAGSDFNKKASPIVKNEIRETLKKYPKPPANE